MTFLDALLIALVLAAGATTLGVGFAMLAMALSDRRRANAQQRTEYPVQTEYIRYERTVTTPMPTQHAPAALPQHQQPIIVMLPPPSQHAPQPSTITDLDIWNRSTR